MCVIAIAWQCHPQWRLVVAANRDEFHDRQAEPLHRWNDAGILAGRDVRAGGTWLAISEHGRFAAVTNVRGGGPAVVGRASRGRLVVDLAEQGETQTPPDDFNPYNVIAISQNTAWFGSNKLPPARRALPAGVHGVSNGPFEIPAPKTERLAAFVRACPSDAGGSIEHLVARLRDTQRPNPSAEKSAAIFIEDAVYGTRCSTIVLVDWHGSGIMIERRYAKTPDAAGDTTIEFSWPRC